MLNLFRDYARSRTPAAIVAFPVEPTIMIPWLAVVPSKVAYKNIEAPPSTFTAPWVKVPVYPQNLYKLSLGFLTPKAHKIS